MIGPFDFDITVMHEISVISHVTTGINITFMSSPTDKKLQYLFLTE
jgi:hypothetical protein